VGIVDREIAGQPLALGYAEDLRAGKADHPRRGGGFGGQQHVPGAQHIDRHDLFRAARRVVRGRPQMDDRRASRGREKQGDHAAAARLDELLSVLVEACRTLAAELQPFIPTGSSALSSQFHTDNGSIAPPAPVFARLHRAGTNPPNNLNESGRGG
jgi:hypothetical protein